MKIKLKCTSIMSDYLPADAVGGRIELEIPDGADFAQLVEILAIPEQERYVVSINESLEPEPLDRRLANGDQVVIMAPLAAG